MGNYKGLQVWQCAHALTLDIYRLVKEFPRDERYELAGQLRCAAVSIESNISEGAGRGGEREFARFLAIARGSAHEVECQLLIARDLGYIEVARWREMDQRVQRISRMLKGLTRKLGQTR